MWLVFRYALAAVRAGRPGTTRARAREHRAAAPDRGADAEPTPPATATGGPAAVVITLPHVAELASPHRDRAARHRGALASDGVASLLEMEESGRQTWVALASSQNSLS